MAVEVPDFVLTVAKLALVSTKTGGAEVVLDLMTVVLDGTEEELDGAEVELGVVFVVDDEGVSSLLLSPFPPAHPPTLLIL